MATLPASVRNVAGIIGMERAVKLSGITQRANGAVYIPQGKRGKSYERLVEAIGEDGAKLMQREHGGELLSYCNKQGMQRKARALSRAEQVRKMLGEGVMGTVIAQRLGVKQQYVSRIKRHGTTSSGWRRLGRGRHAFVNRHTQEGAQ